MRFLSLSLSLSLSLLGFVFGFDVPVDVAYEPAVVASPMPFRSVPFRSVACFFLPLMISFFFRVDFFQFFFNFFQFF